MTQQANPDAPEAVEPQTNENHVIAERREKLKNLRQQAQVNQSAVFPNDFTPENKAADLHAAYDA
ncbi:MAG: lysine--tRNA ligase, partial [Methylotenera sp.]